MAQGYSNWMTLEVASRRKYKGPGIYQLKFRNGSEVLYIGESRAGVINYLDQLNEGKTNFYVHRELIEKHRGNVLVRYKPTAREKIPSELSEELNNHKTNYNDIPRYNRHVNEPILLQMPPGYSKWMTLEKVLCQSYEGPGIYQLKFRNENEVLYIGESKAGVISYLDQLNKGETNYYVHRELIEKHRGNVSVRYKPSTRENVSSELSEELNNHRVKYNDIPRYNRHVNEPILLQMDQSYSGWRTNKAQILNLPKTSPDYSDWRTVEKATCETYNSPQMSQSYSDWMTLEKVLCQSYKGPGICQLKFRNENEVLYIGESRDDIISHIDQLEKGDTNYYVHRELIVKHRENVLVRFMPTNINDIPRELRTQFKYHKTIYDDVPKYNRDINSTNFPQSTEGYSSWMAFEEVCLQKYRGPGIYQFKLCNSEEPLYLGKSKVCVISKIVQYNKREISHYVQRVLVDKYKSEVLVRYKATTRQDILDEIAKELKDFKVKYGYVPKYNRHDGNFTDLFERLQEYSEWMTLEEACRQIYRGPGTYQFALCHSKEPLYIGKSKVCVISKILQHAKGEINNYVQKKLIENHKVLVRTKPIARQDIPGEMIRQFKDHKAKYGDLPLYN